MYLVVEVDEWMNEWTDEQSSSRMAHCKLFVLITQTSQNYYFRKGANSILKK